MYIFICEDSIDGILTGVYDAWDYKVKHRSTLTEQDIALSCQELDNYQLFSDYLTVTASLEKATKVRNTLITQCGADFYDTLTAAILALESKQKKNSMDKANAVYQTICYALKKPAGSNRPYGAAVLNYLAKPCIHRIFELSRTTYLEAHHLFGFLRFSELANGVLFSTVHPKNHCLPILAEHFTDRFPTDNFIIYDESRQLAAVHKAGKNFLLVDASDLNQEILQHFSEREQEFRNLWLTFFHHISIDARTNASLQCQNIPKRFWPDAIELQDKL